MLWIKWQLMLEPQLIELTITSKIIITRIPNLFLFYFLIFLFNGIWVGPMHNIFRQLRTAAFRLCLKNINFANRTKF